MQLSRYTFVQNIIKMRGGGSSVIEYISFFALSRNGKESANTVLWPWSLTYDLEILWVSSGCRGTRSCKISPFSCVQRFTSYRGHREKKTLTKTIQSVATARRVVSRAVYVTEARYRSLACRLTESSCLAAAHRRCMSCNDWWFLSIRLSWRRWLVHRSGSTLTSCRLRARAWFWTKPYKHREREKEIHTEERKQRETDKHIQTDRQTETHSQVTSCRLRARAWFCTKPYKHRQREKKIHTEERKQRETDRHIQRDRDRDTFTGPAVHWRPVGYVQKYGLSTYLDRSLVELWSK